MKKTIERYDLLRIGDLTDEMEMIENKGGDWVRFDDALETIVTLSMSVKNLTDHIRNYYSSYEDKTLYSLSENLEEDYIAIRKFMQ
jgi:hypothetical protein